MSITTAPPVLTALDHERRVDVRFVADLTGKSERDIWRKVSAGKFPRPAKLSPRNTRWRLGDVIAWLNEQHSERGGQSRA